MHLQGKCANLIAKSTSICHHQLLLWVCTAPENWIMSNRISPLSHYNALVQPTLLQDDQFFRLCQLFPAEMHCHRKLRFLFVARIASHYLKVADSLSVTAASLFLSFHTLAFVNILHPTFILIQHFQTILIVNIFVVIGIIGNGNLPLEAIDPSHPLWMEGSPWLWTAGVRIPDCTMAPTSKQSLGYQLVAIEGWLHH